ncbi:hypothetical protein Q3G72_029865 [Acer saccharum]|nr:hypothetical protein Q3G72_029865 [Acer saccharum]
MITVARKGLKRVKRQLSGLRSSSDGAPRQRRLTTTTRKGLVRVKRQLSRLRRSSDGDSPSLPVHTPRHPEPNEIAKAQICELMTNIPCSILNGEMCNEFCWSELRAASGLCVSDMLGPQCLCIIDCD